MTWFAKVLINIAALLVFVQFFPTMIEGVKRTYDYFASPKTRVGVVTINYNLMNSNHALNELKTFFKDKNIKAILLQMDCPGGASGTAQALAEEIKLLKKEHPKPIVTYVENLCASAAYEVAAATDAIIATPSALVGSIGVYIAQPQLKNFIEQFKLQYTFVNSGKYKLVGSPFVAQTDEHKALLQGLTDESYQQFLADIVASRPQLSLATSAEWAEGKIFTGKKALALGLIDAVGSLSTAAQIIKKRAQFDGEILWIHPQKNVWGNLMGHRDDTTIENRVASVVQQSLESWYQQLASQGLRVQG